MSEVQKPVEEPVAAPSTEAPAAAEPTTEGKTETPAVEPNTETAAPATTEAAAATETPAKEEAKPIEAGVLGYKGPGLLKSFIFQKKYFYFATEPLEQKQLTFYLRGEKPEVGDKNGAWASASGKGLLLFSKKEADKQYPGGIIPLADAKDLTEDGTVDFHFTIDGHKHTFQASTLAERDNWVSVLKGKIAEAVELAPTVRESETYKKTLKQYGETRKGHLESRATQNSNPNTAAKKEAKEEKKEEKKEAKEEKKEEKAEAKEEKKEAKEEKKEEKTARKSRSASRKRTSIFGSIFPKKEEEKKEAKEEAAVAPAADATTTPVVAEPAAETPAETVAVPTEPSTETPAATEPATEAKAEEKPKAAKRSSIFGTLSFKKDKKAEEAPVVPAKDEPATTEPVAETAPVIPAVESTEPLSTTAETPAETAPTTNGAEPEIAPANKRKSSLPFGFGTKKEKATTSDEETEKPKSPFAKLRDTVRGKKPEKDAEKTPEVPAAAETKKEETPATAPAATEPEVVSEPTPAAHTSTTQVSATA